MELHGLSDDLIRKLPQRLQLSTGRWKTRLQQILILSGLVIPVFCVWLWWPIAPEWRPVAGIFGACWVVFHILVWQSLSFIVEPVLFARGMLPNVEYLPQDGQVILTDLGGLDALFRAEARVTFYLSSLSAVSLKQFDEGGTQLWQVCLITRKGAEYPLLSSVRSDRAAAQDLATRLAAMLNLPLT